jgi:hypothetical protein
MERDRRPVLVTALAVGLHAAIALATSSGPFFHLVVGSAQALFGGSIGPRSVFDDVEIYYDYATRALQGRIPYRDFAVEYPILAFPLFVLPRLVARTFDAYKPAFALEMLAFDALAVGLLARHIATAEGPDRVLRRLGWYTLCFAALGPLTVSRFDLAPMAIGFAAALAWFSGRNRLGGLAAAVGTLVKLAPGAVAAPALVWEASRLRASRLRGMAIFVATLAIGLAGWAALAGGRLGDSLGYHLGRGLEIGSIYSGALIVAAKATGVTPGRDFNHKSEELLTPWSARVAAGAPAVQAAALLVVMWRFRRSGMRDGLRYAGAAVLAFAATGKVLSPQYVIWPLPMIAALGGPTGRWARPLFLAACLATTAVYPWSFMGLIRFMPLAVLILNVRNALLLAVLAVLVFGPESEPGRA